ncbi:MAG: hypothetical protein A3J09_01100 [Candidatus Zambryskibacteria bacterium RIFCSPLOWO2_02_FULL_51_21]|uniref:Diguanylate cyclase n=1 Tax=Candidatus Zambryskibacteria bacterium RIFCSPHIGHO2_02_FULL_43_37 TaxID=1802749 RepID=A0A1G2THQ0_9BACT|nr:MAG: hypothetical protein A2723_01100 [Candidatus Zambryskibacteria bacterium RIFCSPHIGHO2_01_FULL_52_18]OHA96588.1 MAG: hypothetical protein A3D49_01800 [Candidatus Zambryskibacteria bacterium RIFCSPHIGHO2_02_FULL_43_37]OHB11148.1 MAG: hypothetical protein A3J09_01100 [Candidatus Zambryskibacteria bacterium RIFCSPLOWO2_02_FULL_51_21]
MYMKVSHNRRRVDHAIEQSYRSLVENIKDYAIFMLDKRGRITSWDQGARKLFGYRRSEIIGRNFSALFVSKDGKDGLPKADLGRALKKGRHLDEREYRRKNGTRFWSTGVLTSTLDKTNAHHGYSKIMRDITDQKHLQKTVLHLSTHDYLTGLPNRAFFEEYLVNSIHDEKKNYLLAIFFLDFNNFKLINDEEGHRVGDLILIEISARLTKNVRLSDVVARLGGDEFVILLRSFKKMQDIEHFAKKIIKIFKPVLRVGKKRIKTSVSIGVAAYPRDGKRPGDLLHHVDVALYHSKKRGGNQATLYDDIKLLKKERGVSRRD